MKYYFYVYTKSGNLYKTGKKVDGIKFRNKELDDPKAIRKALDAFIQEIAGDELHVHAFVSRNDEYSKANPLPIGDVIFYKKDGGRFTNRPAIGSSTKNFYAALKEAWSWTPASPEDVEKYHEKLYASYGVEVTSLGKVKHGYTINRKRPDHIQYQKLAGKKEIKKLNSEQQKALKILMSGRNVFLTGGAGTGKTYLLHEFLNKKHNAIVCAPTGIAALQAGGATLHRTFGIPVKCIPPDEDLGEISEAVEIADIIIIDEISMCRIDVFDYVIRKIQAAEKKSKKHKQIVVVGDFYQLPPVVIGRKEGDQYSEKELLRDYYGPDADEGFAFLSPLWRQMNFKTIILTTIIRQTDKSFSRALNSIRIGEPGKLKWISTHSAKKRSNDAITLCSRNKDAQKINEDRLAEIPEESESYRTKYTGKENITASDKPVPDVLKLKKGCRVMMLVNDTEHNFYSNGSLGTIVALEQHYNDKRIITIKLDSGETTAVSPYKWEIKRYVVDGNTMKGKKLVRKETVATIEQYPIRLAYAATIHKAQGQTYEDVTVQPSHCFAAGQLYVALSRVKSIDHLYLDGKLSPKQLICSSTVRKFYESISADSPATPAEKATIPAATTAMPDIEIKKPDIDDIDDIERQFKKSPKSVQEAFLSILKTISHKDCTVENWLKVYESLSAMRKPIVSAALSQ